MSFGSDLDTIFCKDAGSYHTNKNEIYLFRTLISAIHKAASANGYAANVVEIHKHLVNFREISGGISFYYTKDCGKRVSCELADIMLIVYNRNEARLCFMQNKYDRRKNRYNDFNADTRQLYILKNRPIFGNGRIHTSSINILRTARYKSITNYGVFAVDNSSRYYMEYYNADTIDHPTAGGRTRVVKFNHTYPRYNSIDNLNDQLNYAFNLKDFGQGLENMQIGQKYRNINSLLEEINIETVIDYFQRTNDTSVVYDEKRSSVLARRIVIINFDKENND